MTSDEINSLIKEIRSFPNLTYISKEMWGSYKDLYVIEEDGIFAGCCVAKNYFDWVKLGPIAVLSKFHGKGFGSKLIDYIIGDNKNKNFFATTTNKKVYRILEKLGFQEIKPIKLITNFKKLVLKEFLDYMSFEAFKEILRKRRNLEEQRSRRKYYIKYTYEN